MTIYRSKFDDQCAARIPLSPTHGHWQVCKQVIYERRSCYSCSKNVKGLITDLILSDTDKSKSNSIFLYLLFCKIWLRFVVLFDGK